MKTFVEKEYHPTNCFGENIDPELLNEKKEYKKKVKKNKIIVGVLIPVLIITIFLIVLLNDTTTVEGIGDTRGMYTKVLSNIDGIVEANPRFIDIAMLASHDAVTDKISSKNPMDYHDQATILGKVDGITKGFQYRFGKTQAVSLDIQLEQGARFFHIKYTDYDGVWYATHAHLSGTIESYILEVLEYLSTDDAKGEIVCLLFQPLYFGEGKTFDDFHNFLKTITYEGKNIYDYVYLTDTDTYDIGDGGTRISDLTYNSLTKNGTAPGLVLFDRREDSIYDPKWDGKNELMNYFYDMDACSDQVWHSSIGEKNLKEAIQETADRISKKPEYYGTKLRMNQTQASFSVSGASEFFNSINSWSLLKFAEKYNVSLIEDERFEEWLTIMPVFQVDFVNSDYKDFNNRVNKMIIAHNEKTVQNILASRA